VKHFNQHWINTKANFYLSRGQWLWYNGPWLLPLLLCTPLTGGQELGRHGSGVGWTGEDRYDFQPTKTVTWQIAAA